MNKEKAEKMIQEIIGLKISCVSGISYVNKEVHVKILKDGIVSGSEFNMLLETLKQNELLYIISFWSQSIKIFSREGY